MAPASSKEFLDIQATVECGFTLKLVRDMIKTYNPLFTSNSNIVFVRIWSIAFPLVFVIYVGQFITGKIPFWKANQKTFWT